jgi:2'-5' RNA ligase
VKHLRAFIGIDFSDEIKNQIVEAQNKIKVYAEGGRWTSADNFRMALKFLGDVNPMQLDQVKNILSNICSGKTSFDVAISGLWTFDDKDLVKFLWLGLSGELDQLRTIQAKVDSALLPMGFQPEKRGFAPHVTIGQDIIFKSDFKQIETELGHIQLSTMKVKSLYLFESEHVQDQRVYRKIAEFSFTSKI